MSDRHLGQPDFWSVVRLLLKAARKRSDGRRRRQEQLLQNRSDGKSTDWSVLGSFFLLLFMFFLQGAAAFTVQEAVKTAQRVEVERRGKIVVSSDFFESVDNPNQVYGIRSGPPDYEGESKHIAEEYGGSQASIEQTLRYAVVNAGTANLVSNREASPGVSGLARTDLLPAMLGSLLLLWWAVMLAFQGEGVEMDTQRRRHPMWEWLFSHPVPPGAVFLAEMLSPIAANPMYWGAPLFVGILYGFAYDPGLGILAAPLVGVPVAVAVACFGKAIETAVILRLAPRSRGAVIGLMSWLGYTSMMLFLVGLYFIPRFVTVAANFFLPFTAIPWPWLSLFLGARSDGSFSFLSGMLACWIASILIVLAAVWFSVWGAKQGLSGNFATDAPKSSSANRRAHFGREPLYRKEILWFARDRSAIVQTLLVPASVAGFQLFNLRSILVHAESEWNYLCGAAIFFGTYFLWVLGPKSLQSEGTALWIALTWPRGLESLLKAKAWLWSLVSTGLVAIVLGYAAFTFPADIWKIGLVAIGWFLFARSMAEKSVTLVTITSSSGETEKIPTGRRWAAQLGMLTFAIGIVTQQWQLAIIGIVYSWLTAAAMWQNFRARLPFLYDPWSEKLPPPPTLMHAMISVSVMVEMQALISIPILAFGGRESIGIAAAFSYGISAVVISLIVSNFLRERDVPPQNIWCWLPSGQSIAEAEPWPRRFGVGDRAVVPGLMLGAAGGLILGMFAHGYTAVLRLIPFTSELIRKSQEEMAGIPGIYFWYGIMAIGFAPFAEEYLFRGLLYRALDREWGGWPAVLGSAAFFAIYHPPLSWLPVALLGAANCMLFKKTGRLAPAVLLHMVYNAVVLM